MNLPPLLQGFAAVPPLVTDIDLSLDDKYLYVACWGLGEMHQYDVSDPMNPKLAGKVELGGIARGAKHPSGKDFAYEYTEDVLAIDVINGSPLLREWVDDPNAEPGDLDSISNADEVAWAGSAHTVHRYG